MKNFVGATNFLSLYVIAIFFTIIFDGFRELAGQKKKVFIFVFFCVLAFLTAFRMHDIGSDTPSYVAHFKTIANFSDPFLYMNEDTMEPGFVILCWMLSRINNDPQILLIFSAVIIYISIGRFAYKHVKNVGLFCCLFIAIMQFDFFISAMRQAMAIAIMLFAFDYAVKRKKVKFILTCLLAFSFHYTSIVFILIYPLMDKKGDENGSPVGKLIGLVVIFFSSLFFDRIINIIMAIFPKYKGYLEAETFDGVPRLALILKILVYILLYLLPKIFNIKKYSSNRLDVYIEKISYINICSLLIATNAVALARFSNTFSLFATMCYANQVASSEKKDRIIMTVLTLIAFGLYGFIIVLLKTPEWTTTFPIRLIFE